MVIPAVMFLSLSFYANGQLLWGVDRLHFVEKLLGRKEAEPERLAFPSQVIEREKEAERQRERERERERESSLIFNSRKVAELT